MHVTSETVERLVDQFSKLPTIGRKSAHRLAAYILKMPREEVVEIARALVAVKDHVVTCSVCFTVTDHSPCPICSSSKRSHHIICVVEEPNDIMALERTMEYRGVYHVIGGTISPLDGIGPDDLKIRELVARVAESLNPPESHTLSENEEGTTLDGTRHDQSPEPVQEVILALNPTVEGDTTAYYISQLLRPFSVQITQIARGLPTGSALEYADEGTLGRALEGRVNL